MKVEGKPQRTIWRDTDGQSVYVIDQRSLPHQFVVEQLSSVADVCCAISEMHVRGAPLIGITAAYGVWFAVREASQTKSSFDQDFGALVERIRATRPTAINLAWAIERVQQKIATETSLAKKAALALAEADTMVEEEAERCRQIGIHGLEILKSLAQKKSGEPLNVLTHCNAGWLACVDYGTATAPIYLAHDQGIPIHVWVDETRPRNQGARLTAWELGNHGVAHTIIPDNAAGHVMQRAMVDVVLVGTDRTTRKGDVANKIGTYTKALAAKESNIPFYVALPLSSMDWELEHAHEIPIEIRDEAEVKYMQGHDGDKLVNVLITPASSSAMNFAFDITPQKFISGFITEFGLCEANEASLSSLKQRVLVR